MTKKTKIWLPLLVAMLMIATVVVAACTVTATVTYVKGADGATGTVPAAQEVAIGEEIELIANPFSYEGHTFAGWSDGSKTYQAGDKYTVEGNVTFTATWTAVSGGHVCGHVCDICGKCTDATCNDPICAEKCNGHDGEATLDARSYFLCGTINGWSTEGYVFTRVTGTNTYVLEGIELHAEDAMKLRYNDEWAIDGKQMAYGAYFFPGNVFETSENWDDNAVVKAGADGIYNVTLKTSNELTATTERGEGQITEFTFTKVGDIQQGDQPFVTAPFYGAIGVASGDDEKLIYFDAQGNLFAIAVDSTGFYLCDGGTYSISDGVVAISDGEASIGSGTIEGNVLSLTITLEGSSSKEVEFVGEMYAATVIMGGQSNEWYIAFDTPLTLMLEYMDVSENAEIKLDGMTIPSSMLDSIKMDKTHHTIEIVEHHDVFETDITEPINAILLHSSQTQSGAQIVGTLELYAEGFGYLVIQNMNFSIPTVECYVEYTLVGGVITITDAYTYDDDYQETPVNLTGSGKVVGRTVTITVTNTINNNDTDYVFESTLSKLIISNYDNEGGIYVQYLPAGYAFTQLADIEIEGYVLSKVIVNGDEQESSYIESISISEDTSVELVWEKEQVVDPEGTLLSEYTSKQFGFESANNAGSKLVTFTPSYGNATILFKLKLEYSTSGWYRILVSGNYSTSGAAVNDSAYNLYDTTGTSSDRITNQDALAGTFGVAGQKSSTAFTITFSEDNGKLIVVFNLSDGNTITWYEVGEEDFGSTEPEHQCESKCDICQGCLNASCQEEACSTKCQSHETHDYDGTYVLSTGTGNLTGVYDNVDKIVINGTEMKVYNGESLIDTLTLVWRGNSADCDWRAEYNYSIILTIEEYEMSIIFNAGWREYTFTFYAEGHEPGSDENAEWKEFLSAYQGTWTGSVAHPNGYAYDSMTIDGTTITISSSEAYDSSVWTITSIDIESATVYIEFAGTRKTYNGTIVFTSSSVCTIDLGAGSATFTDGTVQPGPGPGTDPEEPTPSDESIYKGSAKTSTSSGTPIVFTEIRINVTKKVDTAIFIGTYDGKAFNLTLSLTCWDKGDYEGKNSGSELYFYSFTFAGTTEDGTTISSMTLAIAVFENEILLASMTSWEDIPGCDPLTLSTGDDEDEDDGDDETGEAVFKGTATTSTSSGTSIVITEIRINVTTTATEATFIGTYDGKAFSVTLTLTAYGKGDYEGTDNGSELYYYTFTLAGQTEDNTVMSSTVLGIAVFENKILLCKNWEDISGAELTLVD